MADLGTPRLPDTTTTPEQKPNARNSKHVADRQQSRAVPFHQIYAQPAPLKTFPLPAFYPSNPVSLVHLAYAWLKFALFPPPVEPAVTHCGVWSAATRSVHITKPDSMRALWEQGFFGKGSLSRSEPNWLKREQVRQGLLEASVSELHTLKRREERARVKWERGRTELDALEQQLLAESPSNATATDTAAAQASTRPLMMTKTNSPAAAGKLHLSVTSTPCIPSAPVGPLQLLVLPNSQADLDGSVPRHCTEEHDHTMLGTSPSSQGNVSLPDSILPIPLKDVSNGMAWPNHTLQASLPGFADADAHIDLQTSGDLEPKRLRHQKSVRFSPKVESTTFQLSDPPSPHRSLPSGPNDNQPGLVAETSVSALANGSALGAQTAKKDSHSSARQPGRDLTVDSIHDREHLQLSSEEAFYLVFAVGALSIIDPQSQAPLATDKLLELFREYSYCPPTSDLGPDDPFLVHYVVYHHFRSLGWVPRHGIKFGVDWMLYDRGPVFNHAEFGVLVIPSYTDSYWKARGKKAAMPSWRWFHGVNRVLTTVFKSLVLVYVDVPPPLPVGAPDWDIPHLLGRYKIREVMVKRWSSNRNRA